MQRWVGVGEAQWFMSLKEYCVSTKLMRAQPPDIFKVVGLK